MIIAIVLVNGVHDQRCTLLRPAEERMARVGCQSNERAAPSLGVSVPRRRMNSEPSAASHVPVCAFKIHRVVAGRTEIAYSVDESISSAVDAG